MLAEADIRYKLIITEKQGHGEEIIRDASNLSDFDAIVAASGDGLVHEIINGLMKRPDREQVGKIPLLSLPVGSANALSAMRCFKSREITKTNQIMHATFVAVKRKANQAGKPMDLIVVDCPDGRLYSCLWFSWGIIADIDIESESMRYLGGTRFLVETIARVVNLRHYRGKISFLPSDRKGEIPTSIDQPVPKNWTTIEDSFIGVMALKVSHLSRFLKLS